MLGFCQRACGRHIYLRIERHVLRLFRTENSNHKAVENA